MTSFVTNIYENYGSLLAVFAIGIISYSSMQYIINNNSEIVELKKQSIENKNKINKLNEQVNNYETQINDYETKINDYETKINDYENTIDVLNTNTLNSTNMHDMDSNINIEYNNNISENNSVDSTNEYIVMERIKNMVDTYYNKTNQIESIKSQEAENSYYKLILKFYDLIRDKYTHGNKDFSVVDTMFDIQSKAEMLNREIFNVIEKHISGMPLDYLVVFITFMSAFGGGLISNSLRYLFSKKYYLLYDLYFKDENKIDANSINIKYDDNIVANKKKNDTNDK